MIQCGAVRMPDCMKIDAEGHAAYVLKGAQPLLEAGECTIFISTHGGDEASAVADLATAHGYSMEWSLQGGPWSPASATPSEGVVLRPPHDVARRGGCRQ